MNTTDTDWEKIEAEECYPCRQKPGSPTLCTPCLTNRTNILILKHIAKEEYERGKAKVGKKILGRARDEMHLRGLSVDRLLEIVREEAALETHHD